jgi:5-methyltetrahydrofolate--homocysteine methyltransferase
MNFCGLILDGAMGSLLLERSGIFAPSEQFNVDNPQLVKSIHLDYIAAGSDIIFANTFGCTPAKHADYADLIERAIDIALTAKAECGREVKVALDIGPTGKVIGKGGITFDQAYRQFADMVVAAKDRADLICIETMTDLGELRAAILAAKDHSALPIMASMSFEKGGHSAFGCAVESFAVTATALGVDAIGINCSLGPAEMQRLYVTLKENTHLPTYVKPNAGMPQIYKGKSIYNLSADGFAKAMVALYQSGADMVGGCCGTTPAYIAALKDAIKDVPKTCERHTYVGKLCSQAKAVTPTDATIIGERINPTGKKLLQAALRRGDIDYVVAQGPKQEEEGASLLDVNLGLSGLDDGIYMQEVVERLMCVTNTPLVIDSSSPSTIEKGLRYFAGRALVNSVNGEDKSLDAILPIVKRYGAAVIGLTLDERGIPDNADSRVAIARKIVRRAADYGIAPQDVYIDCLTMAEGAKRGSAQITLDSLKEVKKLGCRTVLGVSNISYGMPMREDLNAAFLALAKEAGLDASIVNPIYKGLMPSEMARDYLTGKVDAEAYIAYASRQQVKEQTTVAVTDINTAVRRGDVACVKELVNAMLSTGQDAAKELIKALDIVGELYEQGTYFLPQLIAAADAAKVGFDMLYARTGAVRQDKGKLVLATVKGDVHDIGKNIVKAVVANYGYQVIDLGKDVDAERIIDAVGANLPCVLGLSALMTTTAVNMAEIAFSVREHFPDLPILVGGAVITPQFAEEIGCTYCKDAAATVREMGALCG